MYVCVCVCVCMHACMHVSVSVRAREHAYVCMCARICVRAFLLCAGVFSKQERSSSTTPSLGAVRVCGCSCCSRGGPRSTRHCRATARAAQPHPPAHARCKMLQRGWGTSVRGQGSPTSPPRPVPGPHPPLLRCRCPACAGGVHGPARAWPVRPAPRAARPHPPAPGAQPAHRVGRAGRGPVQRVAGAGPDLGIRADGTARGSVSDPGGKRAATGCSALCSGKRVVRLGLAASLAS